MQGEDFVSYSSDADGNGSTHLSVCHPSINSLVGLFVESDVVFGHSHGLVEGTHSVVITDTVLSQEVVLKHHAEKLVSAEYDYPQAGKVSPSISWQHPK